MKRLHLNIAVTDLPKSIAFYSTLLGASPSVEKDDYAKWMLDDPRVNLSISTHGAQSGIDHVGIQAENDDEFNEIRDRLNEAETQVLDQTNVTCCYAQSSKAWVYDPDGVAWETFLTHGQTTVYSDMAEESSIRVVNGKVENVSCCSPS